MAGVPRGTDTFLSRTSSRRRVYSVSTGTLTPPTRKTPRAAARGERRSRAMARVDTQGHVFFVAFARASDVAAAAEDAQRALAHGPVRLSDGTPI
jgi:hypothetical protein